MAIDQRKRQKQSLRKAAKRRKLLFEKRMSVGNITGLPKSQQIAVACAAPIHECLIPEKIFERGIGSVLISRRLIGGKIAVSAFLLDTYCLGAKNAFFKIVPIWQYNALVNDVESRGGTFRNDSPAFARKLIEDTVRYAATLGFQPHSDYHVAKQILGDIDTSSCRAVFQFGRDGKPFFISGPNETQADINRILAILESQVGQGNFDFLVRA